MIPVSAVNAVSAAHKISHSDGLTREAGRVSNRNSAVAIRARASAVGGDGRTEDAPGWPGVRSLSMCRSIPNPYSTRVPAASANTTTAATRDKSVKIERASPRRRTAAATPISATASAVFGIMGGSPATNIVPNPVPLSQPSTPTTPNVAPARQSDWPTRAMLSAVITLKGPAGMI